NVFKPLLPTKQRAIRGQPLADRLWHPNNGQHALLPCSRLALLLLLSSSIVPYGAITFQVVYRDGRAAPAMRLPPSTETRSGPTAQSLLEARCVGHHQGP